MLNEYVPVTVKILLEWEQNVMYCTCGSSYPLFCLWRDMCHICFARSWTTWTPTSVLKLFLLPCSSSLAFIFPCLSDVDFELISDLPVQWLFLTKYSAWLRCQGHTYRYKMVLKTSVAAQGTWCKDGRSSLEGVMRIVQVSYLLQCHGGKPTLKAIF